ncbi:MAG: MerC domain-containing protein [Myxococcota bacterium]
MPHSDTTTETAVDRAGILASAVCAVHCALGVFLPGILAALGLGMWFGETAEYALSAAALLFACSAAAIGFHRHRSWSVLLMLLAGICGLIGARYLEESGVHVAGVSLGILSSITLVLGHTLNIGSRLTLRPN